MNLQHISVIQSKVFDGMQITFQRMRKNCLRQDNDWNELLEHYVQTIVVKFRKISISNCVGNGNRLDFIFSTDLLEKCNLIRVNSQNFSVMIHSNLILLPQAYIGHDRTQR